MGIILDNYQLWEHHELAVEKEIEKLPVCDYCHEPITEEYFFNVLGSFYCERCMKEEFRVFTDDYAT